jgi:hypothetical protein
MTTRRRRRKSARRKTRYWSHTVKTVSTFPPKGLFTKDARTIARSLASRRVSPKGPASGLRMLAFFINRAGRQLSPARRAELERAKRLMRAMIAKRRKTSSGS